jgi:hypothetical protein
VTSKQRIPTNEDEMEEALRAAEKVLVYGETQQVCLIAQVERECGCGMRVCWGVCGGSSKAVRGEGDAGS